MHKIPLAIAFTAVLLGSLVVPTARMILSFSIQDKHSHSTTGDER